MSLREEYEKLSIPPTNADRKWFQNRGYSFEKLLQRLLSESNLSPNTSYKIAGEQIDGSFIYGDRVYLVEAKWHKTEMPASQIYEFKGKVDGKLIGTIGVFISMSGFSADAVDALMYGKDINIILFGKADIEASIEVGFKEVLSSKIRNAAEIGTAYYPYTYTEVDVVDKSDDKTNSDILKETEINKFAFDLHDNKLMISNSEKIDYGDLVIICEGKIDQMILSKISEDILSKNQMKKKISIITAMGKYTIAKIASKIRNDLDDSTKLLMIADSDSEAEKTVYRFKNLLEYNDEELILIDNQIDDWFDTDNYKKLYESKLRNSKSKYDFYLKLVDEFNYEDAIGNHESFSKFYNYILNL